MISLIRSRGCTAHHATECMDRVCVCSCRPECAMANHAAAKSSVRSRPGNVLADRLHHVSDSPLGAFVEHMATGNCCRQTAEGGSAHHYAPIVGVRCQSAGTGRSAGCCQWFPSQTPRSKRLHTTAQRTFLSCRVFTCSGLPWTLARGPYEDGWRPPSLGNWKLTTM